MNILTYVPAFAFPISHLIQIDKMIRSGEVKDVSALTFYGYFLGNFGAYLFTEKYNDYRTIFAFLLTAFLEIVIVVLTQIGTNIENDEMYEKNKYKLFGILTLSTIILIITYYSINYQRKYIKQISSIAGIFPAIFFPLATFFQIWKIIKDKELRGVSCKAWIFQIVANIGAYLLTDKLTSIKSISAFLLTAILDIVIIILIHVYGGNLWNCISIKNLFSFDK
jgi:hypothetical protein